MICHQSILVSKINHKAFHYSGRRFLRGLWRTFSFNDFVWCSILCGWPIPKVRQIDKPECPRSRF
jgi:hypothetical protein